MSGFFEYGRSSASESAVAIVRAVYDAFARRDLEAMLLHASEEIEFWPQGTADRLDRVEPYRGHDGLREYFADAARAWDDLVLHADDIRAAGDGVIVFGHVDAVVNGEPIRIEAVWVWQVRDGKVVSVKAQGLGG